MLLKYVIAWLGLMVIGIANGVLRVGTYGKVMAELTAHQLSTLSGAILMGLYVWLLSRIWPLQSAEQAWAVGFIWLFMTICFEFLFGHYVIGHPWQKLLHDYNFLEGRVWLFILIWTTVAPYVFYRLK